MDTRKILTGSLLALLSLTIACNQGNEEEDPDLLGMLLGGLQDTDQALNVELQNRGVVSLSTPTQESDAMIELGQALFFDKILSGDKNISCATCHFPTAGTGDDLPTAIGAGGSGSASARIQSSGAFIARNSPPLFNLGLIETGALFWDGRVSRDSSTGELTTPESVLNGSSPSRSDITAQLTSALAAQAMFPVTSNDEMRGQTGNDIRDAADNEAAWAAIMARLVGTSNGTSGGYADYRTLFSAAFPDVSDYDDFNFGHAARAIAAFERSAFTAANSPFDQYLAGDRNALSQEQKLGGLVFFGRPGGAGGPPPGGPGIPGLGPPPPPGGGGPGGPGGPGGGANCGSCHRGPLLSDFQFHSIAAPQLGPGTSGGDDLGRSSISGDSGDDYEFRTAPLRNVELTAPYTHAGAYSSLDAVLGHYDNVVAAASNYDSSQLRSDYASQVDTDSTHIAARVDSRDRRLRGPRRLNPGQRANLLLFLQSLTDDSSRDLSGTIPASVPSGLSLTD